MLLALSLLRLSTNRFGRIGLNRFRFGGKSGGIYLRAIHESIWLVWLNRFSLENGKSGFVVPASTIRSNPVEIGNGTDHLGLTTNQGLLSLVQLSVQIRSKLGMGLTTWD